MNRTLQACVGVACCRRTINGGGFHTVFEKYIEAFINTRMVPVGIPTFGSEWSDATWISTLLTRVDGLFLPGSPSNVHPSNYRGEPMADKLFDPSRDATTLPLIRAAVDTGMPVLAVCRGFQELNVALGGSLNADVEADSDIGHRARWPLESDRRYDISHTIRLSEQGRLRALMDEGGHAERDIHINSLHAEGIDQLSPDLCAEAVASDGLVEAASHRDPDRFVVGVQWHAEWGRSRPCIDALLFSAFETACLSYRARCDIPQPGVSLHEARGRTL